jgi:hypothetical protein
MGKIESQSTTDARARSESAQRFRLGKTLDFEFGGLPLHGGHFRH